MVIIKYDLCLKLYPFLLIKKKLDALRRIPYEFTRNFTNTFQMSFYFFRKKRKNEKIDFFEVFNLLPHFKFVRDKSGPRICRGLHRRSFIGTSRNIRCTLRPSGEKSAITDNRYRESRGDREATDSRGKVYSRI